VRKEAKSRAREEKKQKKGTRSEELIAQYKTGLGEKKKIEGSRV